MSNLIAFGDSFTWGSDLSDEFILLGNTEPDSVLLEEFGMLPNKPSSLTWTSLVAEYLNMNYKCYAKPGCSNNTIARTFLDKIDEINSNDLVVINWTWINRWDFYNMDDDEWVTLRPTSDINEQSKFYFSYLQSELWDKWESLKCISMVISMLKERNIQYFMTCIDDLILDSDYHNPKYIKELQSNILLDINWFNGKSFVEWSKERNYPISKNHHPLDKAHYEAFKYIKNRNEFTG